MTDFNWQATSESRRYGLITEEERYQAYKERLIKEGLIPNSPLQQQPLSVYNFAGIHAQIDAAR